ncbi:hypothetical protein [Phaeobacter gallaeciensis]|uniref:hypothetical protein n=1 Tax=Phaeobacter gallaeciensis TaxID=60890 RepID=UPI00237F97A7|nr:hypothetical protein [Phaeobacter gallaeciensis]MDE4099702.1 hypothetical protein [Phaeobacter gallaeciensis]MDE4108563.1 hypothetical protein [Phaeobacter gallaeciensis]MDE4110421.1 hypothetical protein [Phaeobacter gallaeciensis]MDE4117343.1 hypothetical protein [Phaeobacter gallaeciensis]MDE4121816.1 hypothetical protein [Phaeobacter gallaeciensis]
MSYPFQQGSIRLPDPSLADRDVPAASKGHFTGQIVLGDGPGRITQLESHHELQACLCLAARPETDEICEQVGFEWYDADGELHTHYFDFVVVQTDGAIIAYSVRPSYGVSDAFFEEMCRISDQARKAGFVADVRLLTEEDLDPVELFNAELLHSVREEDPEADEAARKAVRDMQGIETLEALKDRTGCGAMGFRALIRLIRLRHLQLVSHERISLKSQVFKRELI